MKIKASRTIKNFNMLKKGEAVLAALSGGGDSVALLLLLKELGYVVSACHVNHNLRGSESDRDELFCKRLCEENDILLFVESIDVNTFCKNNRLSTEEGARILRYKALEKNANGCKIATAHTLSDSFETTLFNLTRGASLKGLCGIPPVRGNIIRPLIECTREEIEGYLSEKNQIFVNDSTNFENEYTRNKIRHEIIPVLKKINPSLFKNYHKTITSLYYDNVYLDKKAHELLEGSKDGENEYSAQRLAEAEMPLLTRAIAEILRSTSAQVSSDRIHDVIGILRGGGKINIRKDVYVESNKSKLFIKQAKKEAPPFEYELFPDEKYVFEKKVLSFCLENVNLFHEQKNVNINFAKTALDYDKIQGKALVRSRRDGDRIRLFNREHTITVKKLFNLDIPLEKRNEIIFLADEEGAFFIEGYGCAKRVVCDEATNRTLTIKITGVN